jgi:tetratricopeptide (TPR) repeat protein
MVDMGDAGKSWARDLVEFALDEDVNSEIEQQRRILRANPHSAKAHFDLGVLCYSQRRIADAVAEYEAAIECDPLFAAAYVKLGEVCISIGDFDRASQYARTAATLGDRRLLEMFERYPDGSSSNPPAEEMLQQQSSERGAH